MAGFFHRVLRGAAPISAVALVAAVAGCGYAGGSSVDVQAPPRAVPPPAPTTRPEPRPQLLKVYFVRGEQFEPVERRAAHGRPGPAAAAVNALLAGPTKAERLRGIDTAIPQGTTLASLAVDGATATVKLDGVRTPATAFDISLRPARAAQIVYTLTAVPGIERVVIEVNGTRRATYAGSTLTTTGALDQQDLSKPVRLARHPAKVPGSAPADVLGVQKRLEQLSYLASDGMSGEWDYRTTQAVLAFQSWHGLARDGVVGAQTIAALEKAAQPVPTTGGSGARIEVYRDRGVVLLVDGPRVIRTVHASAGAAGYETPTGSYSVFRKERSSWSVPYQVWLPYASYFNAGIAFHASDDVPAHAASHGCIRVPAPEAPFVYDFAHLGTPVTVY